MISRTAPLLARSAAWTSLLACCASWAIEAPKPAAEAEPAPAAAPAITPTDENAFYEKLQRVTSYRNLHDLLVSDTVLTELSRGNADVAVATLSTAAAQQNREANVALVRIQHWCSGIVATRPADPAAQIAKLGDGLSGPRAPRIAGVIHAEAAFRNRARVGCSKARFDYGAIEARLRQAADAGHAASASELSQFVRDPAKQEALLRAAIARNYAPAMHNSATNLLMAVQRGQTTQNVGSIRELLKQAGRSIPKAKLDLANCMALGCDGHPADALTAHVFGMDAARDGEPAAFLSMMRMPWGGRLSRTQLLAWQYFGDRLNEAGCMGDSYVTSAMSLWQAIQVLENEQEAKVLEDAKAEGERLWQENGRRAMKETGCETGSPG